MTDGERIFSQAPVTEDVAQEGHAQLGGVFGLLYALEVNQRPPTKEEAARASAAVLAAMAIIRGQHP